MEFGVQVVALAVLLAILFSFFQNDRMPLLSTKVFTGFLLLAVFNNLSEFATLYTLKHYGEIPVLWVRLSHQLFIGSLDIMAMCLYLYVDIKSRRKSQYSRTEWGVRLLPMVIAMIVVLFGQLHYYIGEDGRYSYGPMALTVYASVFIYVVAAVVCIIKRNDKFSAKARKNLFYGIVCWVAVALFQFIRPTLLLSSMAVVLMVLFVYISFENPREMMDAELDDVFSRHALDLVLADYERRKKPFYVLAMVLSDSNLLRNSARFKELSLAMSSVKKYFRDLSDGRIYRPDSNVLCVFLKSEEEMMQVLQKNSQCIKETGGLSYVNSSGAKAALGYFMTVLECPKYAETAGEVAELLEYVGHKGRNQQIEGIVIADPEFIENKNYHYKVEAVVREAILSDGFEVFFQPIYSAWNKSFTSAEALVRLKDKSTIGYISPDVFIPIAEERGLIEKLGDIVFEKVCQAISGNKLWKLGVQYIEVNVSGIQIANEKLAEHLMGYMKQYGISPEFINLELTETAAVEVENNLFHNMLKLRKVGFHFSMDDFGTGYSNFSQMAERRFELIKLDKSLIWPCFGDNAERAIIILEGCISMIKRLGLSIVAEGVETKEQADYLIDKGIEYLQGYYFSRPLPEAAYIAFLQERNADTVSE